MTGYSEQFHFPTCAITRTYAALSNVPRLALRESKAGSEPYLFRQYACDCL